MSNVNSDFLRNKKRIALITLGCKVNQYESQVIRESFDPAAYEEVSIEQPVDIIIINSCTVTGRSDQKTRKLIRSIRQKHPFAMIVVTGCYAQRDPQTLAAMPEIDMVIDNLHKGQIAQIIATSFPAKQKATTSHPFYKSDGKFPDHAIYTDLHSSLTFPASSLLTSVSELKERSRAYIQIQEGCESFCSYCIIPYIRGKIQSKPPELVIQEVKRLLEKKIKEVVLLGIHLGQYGKETNFKWNLIQLLKQLVVLGYDFRLRLSSLEQNEIKEELLDLMAAYPQIIVPHLHIPLQSGEDSILRKMNRHYTTSEFAATCEKIRKYLDHPAITTDVIVGFPGETEELFHATLEFCRSIVFSRMHIFPYAIREGTAAAQWPGQVSEDEKYRRVEKLSQIAKENSQKYLESFIGKTARVLVEEIVESSSHHIIGVSDHYLRVLCPGNTKQIGQFIQVAIQRVEENHLWGIAI